MAGLRGPNAVAGLRGPNAVAALLLKVTGGRAETTAMATSESRPLRLGGQAVIEGVMIRAGDWWAVAVRRPDGAIVTDGARVPKWATFARRVPVVRGAVALFATMGLGMRALSWSRAVSEGDDQHQPSKRAAVVATLVAVGVLVSVFAVLPAALGRWVTDGHGLAFAAVEALARLGLFVGYVAAIGRLPGIQRTFEYHGAEHQAVAAFEAEAPLDVESVRLFSPRHTRCGTDFLVLVALLAVAVFAFVSPHGWWALLASRVLLLPAVAGLAYEVLRLSGRRRVERWIRPLLLPGLAVQRLTTRPASDDQREVAIAAIHAALAGSAARPSQPAP